MGLALVNPIGSIVSDMPDPDTYTLTWNFSGAGTMSFVAQVASHLVGIIINTSTARVGLDSSPAAEPTGSVIPSLVVDVRSAGVFHRLNHPIRAGQTIYCVAGAVELVTMVLSIDAARPVTPVA